MADAAAASSSSREEMSFQKRNYHRQQQKQQQTLKSERQFFWWQSLDDDIECPITLEPISSLPYPPFALSNSSSNNNNSNSTSYTATAPPNNNPKVSGGEACCGSVTYFDGIALASYIISRGIFENPLTRQPLDMNICTKLDNHLFQYCYHNSNNSNII